jgi:hypothetical protein
MALLLEEGGLEGWANGACGWERDPRGEASVWPDSMSWIELKIRAEAA